ncbi:MAG: spermidine/putrescine ABC transporter substrate-binding protein [Desulfobulbaceae bacterium]|nr:spermidine/putrescine ABC transporter substrate-binding protein [Desulfobulbaceae bacterium]
MNIIFLRVVRLSKIFGVSIVALCLLTGVVFAAQNDAERTLTIFNWPNYIGPDTLADFQKETGIKVTELYFDDEEEVEAVIVSEPTTYDLIVSSGDSLREMKEAKLLAKIDYAKIPNFKHIDPAYKNRVFDLEQEYSVPYLVGTTGVVVNKKFIDRATDSWNVLFNSKYKGRIGMLNNPYEVIGAAAKMLGYSLNVTDPAEMQVVRAKLLEQKSLVKGYYPVEDMQQLILDEKLWAAQIYSGEGMTVMDQKEDLQYFIPKEGTAMWIDSFMIPSTSLHKEEAHLFLDYILRPEVNAKIASYLWYATPNKTAEAFMDKEVLESPEVYPSESVKSRFEFFGTIGSSSSMYSRVWRDLTLIQ